LTTKKDTKKRGSPRRGRTKEEQERILKAYERGYLHGQSGQGPHPDEDALAHAPSDEKLAVAQGREDGEQRRPRRGLDEIIKTFADDIEPMT